MRLILAIGLLALLNGPASAQNAPDIAADRVLDVRLAMTLGDARAAHPDLDWTYEHRFMVDFSADCAARDGETLFCALVYEDPDFNTAATIEALVALSPSLQARDGVRVGMALADAEKLWGDATLAFSYANEAREYVNFANGPARISVRARPSDASGHNGAHVGVYADATADQEYQETNQYRTGAEIGSIWVF